MSQIVKALDELDAHRRIGGLPHATGPARAELAALLAGHVTTTFVVSEEAETVRKAVLSEVREKFAKHADDLRRQGEDDAAEIVNDLHDWIYEWETK